MIKLSLQTLCKATTPPSKTVNHGSLAAANRGVAEYELSE